MSFKYVKPMNQSFNVFVFLKTFVRSFWFKDMSSFFSNIAEVLTYSKWSEMMETLNYFHILLIM